MKFIKFNPKTNSMRITSEGKFQWNVLGMEIKQRILPIFDEFVDMKSFVLNSFANNLNDPELTQKTFSLTNEIEDKINSFFTMVSNYEDQVNAIMRELQRIMEMAAKPEYKQEHVQRHMKYIEQAQGAINNYLTHTRHIARFFYSNQLYSKIDPFMIEVVNTYFNRYKGALK